MQSPYQRVNSGFFLVCGQPGLCPFSKWCTVVLWYAQVYVVLGPPHIPKSVHNQDLQPPLWNLCILKSTILIYTGFKSHEYYILIHLFWKKICIRGCRQFKLRLFKNQLNFFPYTHQKLWEAQYFVRLLKFEEIVSNI